ncbi:MAG: hypothetical protein ABID54_04850, partial [Pseudomonadota bacterium]
SSHCARVEYHSGHKWGRCVRFFGAVAACLTKRIQRTAKSVTPFAIAIAPPLFAAADAGVRHPSS